MPHSAVAEPSFRSDPRGIQLGRCTKTCTHFPWGLLLAGCLLVRHAATPAAVTARKRRRDEGAGRELPSNSALSQCMLSREEQFGRAPWPAPTGIPVLLVIGWAKVHGAALRPHPRSRMMVVDLNNAATPCAGWQRQASGKQDAEFPATLRYFCSVCLATGDCKDFDLGVSHV